LLYLPPCSEAPSASDDPVLRHGWDGIFISRCKGTKKNRHSQEGGRFFLGIGVGIGVGIGIGVGVGIGCFRGAHKPYTSRDTGNDRSAQLLEKLEILDRYATPERGK
jgi:hypothetical protein